MHVANNGQACAVRCASPVTRRSRQLAGRLVQLYLGLIAFGVSLGLLVRAELGLSPWATLEQGIALQTGLSFGTVVMLVGAATLLLWIPLRQRPGLGTISNILVIGLAADATVAAVAVPQSLAASALMLVGAILLCGIGGAAYLASRFGPGPRDGLMTGLVALTGWPVRRARSVIELSVLASGWLLGGEVGLGTVLFACSIGPLIQFFLPLFEFRQA